MTRGVLVAAVGLGLAGMLAEPGFAATPDAQSARLDPRKVIEQSEQAIGRAIGNYKLTELDWRAVLVARLSRQAFGHQSDLHGVQFGMPTDDATFNQCGQRGNSGLWPRPF